MPAADRREVVFDADAEKAVIGLFNPQIGQRLEVEEGVENVVVVAPPVDQIAARVADDRDVMRFAPETDVGPFDLRLFGAQEFRVGADDLPVLIPRLPVVPAVQTVDPQKDRTVMRPRLRRFGGDRNARGGADQRVKIGVFLVRVGSVDRQNLVVFADPEVLVGVVGEIGRKVFDRSVAVVGIRRSLFAGVKRFPRRKGVRTELSRRAPSAGT